MTSSGSAESSESAETAGLTAEGQHLCLLLLTSSVPTTARAKNTALVMRMISTVPMALDRGLSRETLKLYTDTRRGDGPTMSVVLSPGIVSQPQKMSRV